MNADLKKELIFKNWNYGKYLHCLHKKSEQ